MLPWTVAVDRLLVIDDDTELCEMLKDYLQSEGFQLESVHEAARGIEQALTGHYALVVLDVMLPGMNGFEVLKQIRGKSGIPVLMLTARGDEVDELSDWRWVPMTICPSRLTPENWSPEYELSFAVQRSRSPRRLTMSV